MRLDPGGCNLACLPDSLLFVLFGGGVTPSPDVMASRASSSLCAIAALLVPKAGIGVEPWEFVVD